MIPRATYRLQLHRGFTFADAARLVPYLARLGISHVYASPVLTARPGSMHGYDVIDPTRVNPELGGEEGLRALVAALRLAGLGLIVDVVPNHMYAGAGNEWWLDVLRHGRASRYAKFFDIDWSALGGKVLLPILGKPYGEVLAAGEIEREGDAIRYFGHVLPLAPGTALVDSLHALLERQHYRLAWWRTAADEINWRRFFDINDLVALRVEDREVFEATHGTLFRLYDEGLIDGLRIDHVDGLADPGAYCRALRERLAALRPDRAYLVVEKILGRDEKLPIGWQTDGTVGYDFMNEVSAVLHDPTGDAPLTRLWSEISGRRWTFADEELIARREILARSFAGALDTLVASLYRAGQADPMTRDVTASALRRCLVEILAHMSVYRTYPDREENNAVFFDRALEAACRRVFPGDRPALRQLGDWLRTPSRAQTQFQQLTAPLAAKSVEDTAFYRYGRLLSRNDVGFDAARFAIGAEDFHAAMRYRLARFPQAMLATATHDHKRGEDTRARLAVLSEIPEEWAAIVRSCKSGDEAMLYQIIVAAWPTDLTIGDRAGLLVLAERLSEWQLKALREAKLATDWVAPDEEYERAARASLLRLFAEPSERLRLLARFAHRISPAGAVNGLAQLLLKLTVPGVPDFYQGTEFWELSLVDPDNRRPVDYARREASLGASPRDCVAAWRDGRVKQAVMARALALRQAAPSLFADGDYLPLKATGPAADHVLAFSRRHGDVAAVVVVTRMPTRLLDADDSIAIAAENWRDTELMLPAELCGAAENILGGGAIDLSERIRVADFLGPLPVALFARR